MGRSVRQKRKNRSSRPVVRPGNSRKKQLNPMGNTIIAQNWNKKETLSQNYRRLGLTTKLGKTTGGTEPRPLAPQPSSSATTSRRNRLALPAGASAALGGFASEVRVERDGAGRIVRVVEAGGARRPNPLHDALNDLDSDSDAPNGDGKWEEWGGLGSDDDGEEEEGGGAPAVIRLLEREARRPVVKKVRHMSPREREWLEALVERHGEDVEAMARDARLNPMQQTVGDIGKRLKKMRSEGTEGES